MPKWLAGLLDRIFAVMGALIFAQVPMFIQQYNQQLTGRVAELKLQIDGIAKIATETHKSIPQYIQRFLESGDSDFVQQGNLMLWTHARYENFSDALLSLSTASVISKPYVFIRDFNWEVARSTFTGFQWGIPFTLEGLCYALIGIGIGYALFYILSSLFGYVFRQIAWLTKKSILTFKQ